MILLPVPAEDRPFSNLKVTLDGVDYILRLEWQDRSGWYLGIRTADDETIVSLRRLVVNHNMLHSQSDPALPRGGIYLVDTSGLEREAGYRDIGDTHQFVYLTEDEVAAL